MTASNAPTPAPARNDVGGVLFRMRLAVIVAFFAGGIVVSIVLARSEAAASSTSATLRASGAALLGLEGAFLASAAVCAIAFVLRTTGEARLGSAVYGQQASTRVVTSGPFRLSRHPLYLGTWLFFVAAFFPYLPPLVVALGAVLFFAALWSIAGHEERALLEALGAPYAEYQRAVPRLLGVPRAVPADGVTIGAGAWAAAVLGNLGIASTALFRVVVAVAGPVRGLLSLNALLLLVWAIVLIVRRVRSSSPAPRRD